MVFSHHTVLMIKLRQHTPTTPLSKAQQEMLVGHAVLLIFYARPIMTILPIKIALNLFVNVSATEICVSKSHLWITSGPLFR